MQISPASDVQIEDVEVGFGNYILQLLKHSLRFEHSLLVDFVVYIFVADDIVVGVAAVDVAVSVVAGHLGIRQRRNRGSDRCMY